jgi:hypothetical protein
MTAKAVHHPSTPLRAGSITETQRRTIKRTIAIRGSSVSLCLFGENNNRRKVRTRQSTPCAGYAPRGGASLVFKEGGVALDERLLVVGDIVGGEH